ncbi:MAG: hypothetical protein ABH833_01000 [Parcubacteria group bacterium]
MVYAQESLDEINGKYHELILLHRRLLLNLGTFQQKLNNEKAREYLMHGIARRLDILFQCIENIFTIFTPNRTEHLSKEELSNLGINLHAFFINIAGILDNLGWVFVYENNLFGRRQDGKIDRNGVGLFNDITQQHLNPKLREYLQSELMSTWYDDYTKKYRDSLAHRIPLYVPPSILNNEQSKEFSDIEAEIQGLDLSHEEDINKWGALLDKQRSLGVASHFFAHSMDEGCRPVYFHAQIIADYLTIDEVINIFCDDFYQ